MKIMIVDDEPTILLSLSYLLSNKETTVITCSTIAEAESELASCTIDLVIADIRLSGMYDIEGIELISHIKGTHADTAVIIMTAFGTDEMKEMAYKLGAFHYYEKPIDISNLISKVQKIGIRKSSKIDRCA